VIEALIISNIALWIGVLVLGGVVVVLTRQIGLLHERVAPAGALSQSQGPAVGDAIPEMELRDVDDRSVVLGEPGAEQRTLLFFLSPTCPVCETLLPTLRRVVADEPDAVRLVLASDGEPQEHRTFRREHDLEDVPYLLSMELGIHFGVAKLPTAVLIDRAGIVRAKGIVNTREHLESLFAADELDVGSIQDFLQREADAESPQSKVRVAS
jgi:methylamine dehydrogenase accessory protein MauD